MKGARRTRKARHQAGFADLMAPSHPSTSMRGVVTGVSRTQSTTSTPNQTIPNPTTPPPPDEDWGALLQTTPKRKMSPQRPIIATTPTSSSPTPISPTNASHEYLSNSLARSPTPAFAAPTSPPTKSPTVSASDPQPTSLESPSTSTAVPAFLSGWDGADGWGDDPSLDDSDPDTQEDPWGAWPESDDLPSSHTRVTTSTQSSVRPEQPSPPKPERPTDSALDIVTQSMWRPPVERFGPPMEQPDEPAAAIGDSTINQSCEDSTTAPKISLVDPVAGGHPVHDNSPQPVAHNEHRCETAETETVSDENPKTPIEEQLQCTLNLNMNASADGTIQSETFSEEKLLHAATIGASESQPEDLPWKEDVSGESKADSCLETDNFSYRHEVHGAQEGSEDLSLHTQGTHSKQETTNEERKAHFESQEDEKLQREADQDQEGKLLWTDTKGKTVGQEQVAGSNTEIHRDHDTTATSTFVPTDQRDSARVNLPTDVWGFEQTGQDVPVDEAGWGWGETDESPTSNIDGVEDTQGSSGMRSTDAPNDGTSESARRKSPTTNSASLRLTDGQEIRDDTAQVRGESQELRAKNNEVDPFLSLEASTAPEDGWGFGEDPREANADNWGWATEAKQDEVEFTVDVDPRIDKESVPLSVPAQDSSTQETAYESFNSSDHTVKQVRVADGPNNNGDKSVRDPDVDEESSQLAHGLKSSDYDTFEAPRSSEKDNINILEAQQNGSGSHEADSFIPVGGNHIPNEHNRGEETLNVVAPGSKHCEWPSKEGQTDNGSFKTIEEDPWGTDAQSTDVDVSSTVAGTDVPSIAAPSSTDEAEWEPDRNELRLNPTSSPNIAQNSENPKSVGPEATSSFLWSSQEGTSQMDRLWANPNAMWSSPDVHSQSPVVAEDEDNQATIVGQERTAEVESPREKALPPKSSDTSNTTMIGMVDESSLRPPMHTSLSGGTPAFPQIELKKFQHCHEEHTGEYAIKDNVSYDESEMQTVEVPDRATENKNTSNEPGIIQLESQDHSVPPVEGVVVSDNAGSAYTPAEQSSNSYWTQRLDQSMSQRPNNSEGNLRLGATTFLTKPSESLAPAPVTSANRLEPARNNTLEKEVVNTPLDSNVGTASSGPIKPPASVPRGPSFVSRPSGNMGDGQVLEPTAQRGPIWEAQPDATGAWNSTTNAASSLVKAKDDSEEIDSSNNATEARIANLNGPTSNDRVQPVLVTQNLQWPAESVALEDGGASKDFENIEGGCDTINNRILQSDARQEHEPIFDQANWTSLHDDNSSLPGWDKYAPRLSSRPAQESSAEATSGVSPAPPAQRLSDKEHKNVTRTEAASYDMASYDPFSLTTQDDAISRQTKNSYEAFDWSLGVQERACDPEVSLSTVSAVPQGSPMQSVRGPPKLAPEKKMTELDARHDTSWKDDGKDGSTLKVLQDSHSGIAAESIGDLVRDTEQREVFAPEDGRDSTSSHIQPRRIQQGGEEEKTGTSPYADIRPDDIALPASDPHSSLSGDIGFEQYAPRGIQPAQSGSGIPLEHPSSSTGREAIGASNRRENSGNFPYMAASNGMTLSPTTFQDDHAVSYQTPRPSVSAPYEADLSYAAPEPPAPTSVSDGCGEMQSRLREGEGFSLPDYAVLTARQIHADQLPASRPPPPAAPDVDRFREALNSTIPRTTKTEAKDWNQNPSGLQEGHEKCRMNGFPYAPVHNEGSEQVSHAGSLATTEFDQSSLPPYGAEAKPATVSNARQTGAPAQYYPPTYEDVTGPLRSQERVDVPASKDTSMQAQGSYGVPGEFSHGFNAPSSSQEAAVPPPPIPYHQEVFPSESMIDPSTFSYPYSILDTETSGDLSYRPQRPLVSWGFGGKLVTIIPPVKYVPNDTCTDDRATPEVKGSSTVHIHDLTSIAQDGSNDDWAAASEAAPPLSLPARPPDLFVYADMCDRLSKLSVGLSGSESEDRAAMWRILALLCRQGTSDWRINASTAICGPSSVPMFGRNDSSSLLSGKSHFESPLRQSEVLSGKSEVEKGEAAAEVERLLTTGNGVEAIRVAQEAGLWPIALVLAATIDKSLYMKAVSDFAKSSLHDGSALQTLCLSTAEDESEILTKATSPSGLKEWRKTVGMLLTTRRAAPSTGEGQRARFLRLINQIGEALVTQRNDIVAGHVCFLLSGRLGPLDSSNIPLLGADSRLPAGRPRSMGSSAVVLQSLVLEAIGNVQNGAVFPHILPFRLLLAEEVCAVGRPGVALAHCESISSEVRKLFESGRKDISSKVLTLPFLSRLESLEHRLRVHLGMQRNGEKKGGLSALGKSLSSVFTRGSTTDSKITQVSSGAAPEQATHFDICQRTPHLQSAPFNSASPPQPAVSSVGLPQTVAGPQWTPRLEPPQLQPLPVDHSSQSSQPEAQGGNASGNDRWNSLVSKTIRFIAPAEGDLSPPLKARGDQGVPFYAQPTPLGLGAGIGSRAPGHDAHTGHMRSASVGDVPIMQSPPLIQAHAQGNDSHRALHGPKNLQRKPYDQGAESASQAIFNGVPVQRATTDESSVASTHRRSASDITFESQTSEKKPPRPPKKSSALPQGVDLLAKKEKAPAAKGWRSRLSEKIRAAFSGPPRAHMGVENKFRYDKERGRWIMEGEDPNEEDDIPPPPPDDDAIISKEQKVPYSQSYESLPNPDLNNQFMAHSQVTDSFGADGVPGGATGAGSFGRYSYNSQLGYKASMENVTSRDTGSESSVASAASAPVPYSTQTGMPMSADPSNKFRARPGRLSGRRAYVDTFNKGTPAISTSATVPGPTRPGMPGVPGVGSSSGSGYRIFTPSPAVSSEGLSTADSTRLGGGVAPGTSSIVESSDDMHPTSQETQTNNGQQSGDSFGYGLSKPAPMPSMEQYHGTTRNERKPRLMA